MLENVFDSDNLQQASVVLQAVHRWLVMTEPTQLILAADQVVRLEAAAVKRAHAYCCFFQDLGCSDPVYYDDDRCQLHQVLHSLIQRQ